MPQTESDYEDQPMLSDDDDDEEMDEATMLMLQILHKAKELAGSDDDTWDNLEDDAKEEFMEKAKALFTTTEAAMELDHPLHYD